MLAIFHLERGMPSNRKSSTCNDYVPALCTHRPSLLPIERSGEVQGSVTAVFDPDAENCTKPYCLEEGEVVTRFP